MTGVSVEDITTARQSGDSLAAIAEANDVTTDDYVAAVVEAATTAIDDAVADGKLSEDRAATIKEGLTDKVTAMVTSEAGWHGRSRGWAVKLDSKPSPVVVLSELSGLSVEEIREQRVEGTSLADIGEANDVSKDDYVDELVDRSDGGHRRDGRGGTPERGPCPDDQGWVGGSRGVPGDRHRRAGGAVTAGAAVASATADPVASMEAATPPNQHRRKPLHCQWLCSLPKAYGVREPAGGPAPAAAMIPGDCP